MTAGGAVGILGGTFDPIHLAHLRLAQEAADTLGLVEVRLVPSATPPHRQTPMASAEHRLAMVRLAIADNRRLVADDRELRRDAPSYTVDTLESLRAEFGPRRPLCLVMGADAFVLLETWSRWKTLFELAHVAVAHRPGYPPARWADHMGQTLAGELERRHTDDPARIAGAPGGGVFPLAITQMDISGRQIRALLAGPASARYLLPRIVLDYIEIQRLYRETNAS